MSSNSQNDIDEEFLNTWLLSQNLPTNVPLQMKILTFAGHIFFQLDKMKKPCGRPKKEFSDYVRRADIFRSIEKSWHDRGFENLSKTEVIKICIQTAKILHSENIISDEELALWTKASRIKSILDHLPKGFAELDVLSQNQLILSRMTARKL